MDHWRYDVLPDRPDDVDTQPDHSEDLEGEVMGSGRRVIREGRLRYRRAHGHPGNDRPRETSAPQRDRPE